MAASCPASTCASPRGSPPFWNELGARVPRLSVSPSPTSKFAPLTLAPTDRKATAIECKEMWMQMQFAMRNWDPEEKQWHRLFGLTDADKSGLIGLDEFEGIMRERLLLEPWEMGDAQIRSLFLAIDANNSGSISNFEFADFLVDGVPKNREATDFHSMTLAEKRANVAAMKAERSRLRGT